MIQTGGIPASAEATRCNNTMSSHRLRSGRELVRTSGRMGKKSQPRRSSAHDAALQHPVHCGCCGKSCRAPGNPLKPIHDGPPGVCEELSERRHPDAALELFRVAHQRGQLLGGWPEVFKKVLEDLPGSTGVSLPVPYVWKQRMGEGRSGGREAGLVGDVPVRHSGIDWIADDVASPGIEKLGCEVEFRIVHDRGFTAFLDVPKQLADH